MFYYVEPSSVFLKPSFIIGGITELSRPGFSIKLGF